MSDALDRAVDAQIDAYRPATVPPFSAIEARKQGRDRLRVALGAGALSVVGLAAAVVIVPSLGAGGDRLTPGEAHSGTARTAFAVQYTPTADDTADPTLGRCLELPGAHGTASLEPGDPPTWIVGVEGTDEQAADVRDCLEGLRNATVRTVPADDADADR
jgi:hypothetical protein